MPDLETRLRADADRRATTEPPSLDVALDAVTTPGHAHRHGRGQAWLAAAAAVLVVAGLATFLSMRSSQRATPPTPADSTSPPPGVPTQIHDAINGELDLVHVTDVGARSVAAIPGDASKLGVYVPAAAAVYFENEHKRVIDHSCAMVQPKIAVRENAHTVRLTVSGFQYIPARFAHRTPAFRCATASGYRKIDVELPRPVGNRTIVLTANGKPVIASDPSDRPAVGFVPPGFHLVRELPPVGSMGTLSRDYKRGPTSVCKRLRCPELTVDVGPSPGSRFAFGGPRFTHTTTVNGFPATLNFVAPKRANGGGCITWHETPSTRERQVCVFGGPKDHITTALLLEVARSVH